MASNLIAPEIGCMPLENYHSSAPGDRLQHCKCASACSSEHANAGGLFASWLCNLHSKLWQRYVPLTSSRSCNFVRVGVCLEEQDFTHCEEKLEVQRRVE